MKSTPIAIAAVMNLLIIAVCVVFFFAIPTMPVQPTQIEAATDLEQVKKVAVSLQEGGEMMITSLRYVVVTCLALAIGATGILGLHLTRSSEDDTAAAAAQAPAATPAADAPAATNPAMA